MPSTWLRKPSAWVVAALVALLVLGPTGSPVDFAAVAALAIAAILGWTLLGPSARSPYAVGRRFPVPADVVGPMRSFNPDAPGRPRPRAPGA